ncbi:unnamed protein product [Urochloa humidicola]
MAGSERSTCCISLIYIVSKTSWRGIEIMLSSSSRAEGAYNPPQTPAGDPPAALHVPDLLTGDPPAVLRGGTPRSARSEGASKTVNRGKDKDSVAEDRGKDRESRGKGVAQDSVDGEARARSGAAPLVSHHISYRDALAGVKTFKPRFDSSCRSDEWRENTARRAAKSTVWGRLGPRQVSIHDKRGGSETDINGFLQILKTKAWGRCFNCFARDHCIAECRDPPRCLLCSRSGHKARFCPAPPQARLPPAPVLPPRGSGAPSSSSAGGRPGGEPSSQAAMNFIPGDVDRRPDRVVACAARSAQIREAERDLLLRGLIAVQLDARVQLTCEGVRRDAILQLRIPESTLWVTRISTSKFLLQFDRPELRNAARARGTLSVGCTTLHLMPWGREADGSSCKLPYRARVCLEGVPDHAHQPETVVHLLPKQSFVEEVDLTRETEDEPGCFILWIWCMDPDALGVEGTLKIEEPMVIPEEYSSSYAESSHLQFLRADGMTMMQYKVLIHLDRVEDYSPPPAPTYQGRFGSDVSGLPSDENMVAWPERHSFVWHLGQPDRLPDLPRVPVHARLGSRRDRSPPRGGGERFLPDAAA